MKIIIELNPYELTDELVGCLKRAPKNPPVTNVTSPLTNGGEDSSTKTVAQEEPKNPVETGTLIPQAQAQPTQEPKNPPVTNVTSPLGNGGLKNETQTAQPTQQALLPVAEPKNFTVRDLITAATALTREHPEMREVLIDMLKNAYHVRSINDLQEEQISSFAMSLRELGASI